MTRHGAAKHEGLFLRENTRTLYVGGVPVGGGHPIPVQSMTNTDTRDVAATVAQITALAAAGCEIVRLAIPDEAAARALSQIKKALTAPVPLVADIHFDHNLALESIAHGADALRINPGNIGGMDRVREVAAAAQQAGIPIRVGVNAGSLERGLPLTAEGLWESARRHIHMLEDCGFYDIALSIKASDIPLTVAAHRLAAQCCHYPLHIGITEAGTPYRGTIKSAAGIGALLAMGIGDTLRVSLTGDPVPEVRVAREILQAFGLRQFGAKFVSCPTCGRANAAEVAAAAEQVEAFCESLPPEAAHITVAVMGCVVNGPGEAKEADYGIAFGQGAGVLFRHGKVVKTLPASQLAAALLEEIKKATG